MKRWVVTSTLLTLAVLAAALSVGLGQPGWLLEQIPVHWDVNMEPDRWVAREDFWMYLLIFPGAMGLFVVMMLVLPRLSPKNFEVDRFAGTWGYVMTLLVGLMGYIFALQVWSATGSSALQDRLFVAGFFVAFALLGNVLGKVQRNFWLGVRTPWTLASDAVWVRTHRVAAWLFVVTGVLGAAAVLTGLPFWVALVAIAAGALWPAVYSLLLYKRLEREGRV